MSNPANQVLRLRCVLPASLAEVDRLCLDLRRSLQQSAGPQVRFITELLARELLNNAVLHGGRGVRYPRVSFRLNLNAGRLSMRVADQGKGFNWTGCLRPALNPRAHCGRGLWLLRRYCDSIEFNTKGNSIAVHRRFATR